ncbi:hypothetical protein [Sporolactobacillus shoreicorticis]|uniref:Uncharacterized protein n=1 Tax=Sporolactobacillus shoreicorticis TaxID=1923877 RepID=A0ABW5S706_9BACL
MNERQETDPNVTDEEQEDRESAVTENRNVDYLHEDHREQADEEIRRSSAVSG